MQCPSCNSLLIFDGVFWESEGGEEVAGCLPYKIRYVAGHYVGEW